MKKLPCYVTTALLLVSLAAFASSSYAQSAKPDLSAYKTYPEAKAYLLTQDWQPVNNSKIASTSLFAQEVYQQGYSEVVECVSMELDGCWFRWQKNKQYLEIKTTSRQLTVDSYRLIKKPR